MLRPKDAIKTEDAHPRTAPFRIVPRMAFFQTGFAGEKVGNPNCRDRFFGRMQGSAWPTFLLFVDFGVLAEKNREALPQR